MTEEERKLEFEEHRKLEEKQTKSPETKRMERLEMAMTLKEN